MAKATDAANAVRRAAKQYEAFMQAAEILETIGSLDNAAQEGLAALDVVRADIDLAKNELVATQTKTAAIIAEHDNIIAKANEVAKKTIEAAKIKENEIISNAECKATSFCNEAKSKAGEMISAAQLEADGLQLMCDTMRADIEHLTARAREANESAEAAERRLEKVRSSISKLADA